MSAPIDGTRVLERLPPLPDAVRSHPGVWVVGGAVRDVLLGRAPRELDLLVEGDAPALARRIDPDALVHERFGTATAAGVDLASTRTETYPEPGALPEVRLGATAREDLARRDFSVNAIAVRLADGAVAAWPGAAEDLAAGVLRVLHPRSFADDPTRILRMARYAARLGFAPDGETARLAAAARLDTVNPTRLGEELRLLLHEPLPAAFAHARLEVVVDPAFTARDSGLEGAAALAACLTDAPGERLRARLDALAFPAAERDVIVAAATRAPALAERLRAAADDVAVWEAARRERPETVAVAGALGAGRAAARWLDHLRHLRLQITGDDLVAAGLSGPAVGAALEAAMRAFLAGAAPDRDRQLHAALQPSV